MHSSLPLLPGLDLLDLLEEDGLFPLINRAGLATAEYLLLTSSFSLGCLFSGPNIFSRRMDSFLSSTGHGSPQQSIFCSQVLSLLVVSSVVQTSSQISSPGTYLQVSTNGRAGRGLQTGSGMHSSIMSALHLFT